jgi:hypothetical protein
MTYLISAWSDNKKAGSIEQTRRPSLLGADSVLEHWRRNPPIGTIKISIFDELAGLVLYTHVCVED